MRSEEKEKEMKETIKRVQREEGSRRLVESRRARWAHRERGVGLGMESNGDSTKHTVWCKQRGVRKGVQRKKESEKK